MTVENTFYHFEDNIYRNLLDLHNHRNLYNIKSNYDIIKTAKSYEEFVRDYEKLRLSNSILDSIECAK